jgi:hypothetical protein
MRRRATAAATLVIERKQDYDLVASVPRLEQKPSRPVGASVGGRRPAVHEESSFLQRAAIVLAGIANLRQSVTADARSYQSWSAQQRI